MNINDVKNDVEYYADMAYRECLNRLKFYEERVVLALKICLENSKVKVEPVEKEYDDITAKVVGAKLAPLFEESCAKFGYPCSLENSKELEIDFTWTGMPFTPYARYLYCAFLLGQCWQEGNINMEAIEREYAIKKRNGSLCASAQIEAVISEFFSKRHH